MNRTFVLGLFAATLALAATQACSSDEDTPASTDAGTTSTDSGKRTPVLDSGEPTPEETNTCTPAGGACICGTLADGCPGGGTRTGNYRCPAPFAGTAECVSTCCLPGDAEAPPPVDAGTDSGTTTDAGATDAGKKPDAGPKN